MLLYFQEHLVAESMYVIVPWKTTSIILQLYDVILIYNSEINQTTLATNVTLHKTLNEIVL